LRKNTRNKDVVCPFLNGEDLNGNPDQSPSRLVINFYDWPLEKAESYPDAMAIVRDRVFPVRQMVNREAHRKYWWHYGDKRPALYAKIRNMRRVIVVAATSRTLAFCFLPPHMVFSHATYVFAYEEGGHFAVLQSAFHEGWARRFASSMKGDLRYTPTDCFINFPFPNRPESLNEIGDSYHERRRQVMIARQEGLTKIYNRFHNPDEKAEDIERLRALHVELDQVVAIAYGWSDLDLCHGFHETKQGIRYTTSESARRIVLDRLLALNHRRYAEEVAEGLHDKKKAKGKGLSHKAGFAEPDLFQ